MREERCVPLESAVCRARVRHPAVVEVEAVVACSEEAAGYHGLGGFGEEGLVEIAFEAGPVVEAHWWGGEELGVFD